jgi:DNA replication and repair protein RecF
MTASSPRIACRELRLRQFRNFPELDLVFPPAGVAIIGENGSGKTNLLEAVYYLEIFRSFRGTPDEQLVRFEGDAFFIRGRFEGGGGGERELTAGFERRTRRKRVAVDGAEPERMGDAIGRAGVVIFSPFDGALVAGPPGERRRFLDILLSLNAAGYLPALQRFRQALRQRNSLLRDGAAPALIAAWDEGFVAAGARIVALRSRWVAARGEDFARRYAAIGGGAPARLRYHGSVPVPAGDVATADAAGDDVASGGVPGEAGIREAFRRELVRLLPRERERRMTLVGPHRDDLGFFLEGPGDELDLRTYGSGGQQRTAAIALRMVEAATVREVRGIDPIVLLDDVFAELDAGRSRRILELLDAEERGQVILTAPKESDLEPRRGVLPHWRIAAGRIET